MAIAIPLDRVQQVLAMRIGTALAHSGAGTHAAEQLRHYRVGDDLSALCEALRDGLFRDLYAILGPQMRVSMPDGRKESCKDFVLRLPIYLMRKRPVFTKEKERTRMQNRKKS